MTKWSRVLPCALLLGCGGGATGSTEIVCGDGTSGTLSRGGRVEVGPGASKDLAGAAVAASDKTDPPAAAVTIECVDDIVPPGYVALGPAVRIGPESAFSARPFDVTLPYKAARLPQGATRRHVRVVARRAKGDGATPFFPTVTNLKLADADRYASRASFRAAELTTYQVVAAADAGQPVTRRYTYRGIAGVSMGGSASTSIGLRHPDKFDMIGSLGGDPGPDTIYFANFAWEYVFGGFCTAAHEAAGKGKVGELCLGEQRPLKTDQFELGMDFEHLLYQSGDGVGLTLRRNLYVKGSRDLARTFGNPFYYNPEHAYLPPGVPTSYLTAAAQWRCENPIVLTNFHDREYNPDGALPVITFCDGGDSTAKGLGVFDPDLPQTNPFEVALAVDVNMNGRRDAGEPVIVNAIEPYRDVGSDALANEEEPGYDPVTNPDPNGDDYHYWRNPRGTEGNFWRDDGEPYEDVGLDGVADTCQAPAAGCYDFGQGDGQWTISPNLQRWIDNDAGTLIAKMSAPDRDRLKIWADAGIRDFFNAHVAANGMVAAMHVAGMPTSVYDDFLALGDFPIGQYDFQAVKWDELAENLYVRYGNPDATPSQIEAGDGRHVGTALQLVNRITSMFAWISRRWPNGDRALAPTTGMRFLEDQRFVSPTTGRETPYALFLPPGYDQNPQLRYPVVYFLHGYGQEPDDLIAVSAIFENYMIDPDRPEDERFQKLIIVYVDGRCRPGGDGVPPDPGGDGCEQGTWYANSPVNPRAQMETHLFELMDYIDANYRTKPEEMVEIVR